MIYHNDSGDGYSISHEPHSNPLDNATIYPPSPAFIEQLQADMYIDQFVPYNVIEPSPEAPAGHMSNTSHISASFREPQSQPNAILYNHRTFSGTSFRPSKHLFEQEPAAVFQTSTFNPYNDAHYNNPNFQPEPWTECTEMT
jgi:hypothetical protein